MHSAVVTALATSLPTETETRLLRACLLSDETGRKARRSLIRQVDDLLGYLAQGGRGRRRLAPLLAEQLSQDDSSPVASQLKRLRTATFHEQLRSKEYNRILADLISALSQTDIEFVVVAGGALANTIYAEPALRHCHDINLLFGELPDETIERALVLVGFFPSRPHTGQRGVSQLLHRGGLPLVAQRRLFEMRFYEPTTTELRARCQSASISGQPFKMLSLSDNLHHVCVRASYCRGRTSLMWVCDAWLLIERMDDDEWKTLMRVTEESGSVLPMRLALDYMASRLHASVPAEVLSTLEGMSSRVTRVQRDFALRAFRRSATPADVRRWRRAPLRERTVVALWRAYPSREYVQRTMGPDSSIPASIERLLRALRWARARLRRVGLRGLSIVGGPRKNAPVGS